MYMNCLIINTYIVKYLDIITFTVTYTLCNVCQSWCQYLRGIILIYQTVMLRDSNLLQITELEAMSYGFNKFKFNLDSGR